MGGERHLSDGVHLSGLALGAHCTVPGGRQGIPVSFGGKRKWVCINLRDQDQGQILTGKSVRHYQYHKVPRRTNITHAVRRSDANVRQGFHGEQTTSVALPPNRLSTLFKPVLWVVQV